MKITIYDVAKESGVSPSTVSKVINRTGRISTETQTRVLDTMQRLAFHPNVVASALKAKRTYTVALLISDITNPFCNHLAKAVEDVAITHGYNVLLASTSNNAERHRKLIDMLLQKQVDGYIVSSFSEGDEELVKMLAHERPVVLADRRIPNVHAATITSDNVAGGYLATQYLLQRGHRRIGILLEDPRLSSSAERMQGYRLALTEREIEPREDWMAAGYFGLGGGRRMLRELYKRADRPTAIFAVNDLLAIGVLQEAFDLKWRVPEELSVVGYDDIPEAAMVRPPLTTVRQPVEEMGTTAFNLLLKFIEVGNSSHDLSFLTPHLMERDSVVDITASISH